MHAYPWLVTKHAAEQYARRVDRTLTTREATELIARLLPVAALLPIRTNLGHERWQLPEVPAVVVARPDPKLQVRVAVTTLGPLEQVEDVAEDVLEAYARARSTPDHVAPGPASTTPKGEGLHRAYDALMAAHQKLKARHSTTMAALQSAQFGCKLASRAQYLAERERDMAITGLRAAAHESTAAVTALERVTGFQRQNGAPVKPNGAGSAAVAAVPSVTESPEVARLRAHAERAEAKTATTKHFLRETIITLRAIEHPLAKATLVSIIEQEPGLVSDEFCYPDRFTKQERANAAMMRDAQEQHHDDQD